jgi:hypothetical protein
MSHECDCENCSKEIQKLESKTDALLNRIKQIEEAAGKEGTDDGVVFNRLSAGSAPKSSKPVTDLERMCLGLTDARKKVEQRAVVIAENLPTWGRRTKSGYVLSSSKDNVRQKLREECDVNIQSNQAQRAMRKAAELADDKIEIDESLDRGFRIILPFEEEFQTSQ